MASDELKNNYLFKDLEIQVLEELERISERIQYHEGDRIIEVGKENDSVWILAAGSAVIRDMLPGGLEMDLHRLQKGDIFGEMSYLDTLPASASVIVEGAGAEVLRIRFNALDEFFAKNLQAQCRILRQMAVTFSQRLRRSNKDLKNSFMASLGFIERDS